MQHSKAETVRRFPECGSFLAFVEDFLLRNEPCLFGEKATQGWKARALWQNEGRPDLDYLTQEFGSVMVPVADCTHERFSAHAKTEMRFADYAEYWRALVGCKAERSRVSVEGHRERDIREGKGMKLLYLKDWHFARDFHSYEAYSLLDFFQSDWLNELWDVRQDVCDDYRFVYMGPMGTWTPFHADVFRSYSWSANVCGRKEWLLFSPGEEDQLRDRLGNLPLDVTSGALKDRGRYPKAGRAIGPIRVEQGPGEVIFIPRELAEVNSLSILPHYSGWHHQVRNLEDTISINHNWTNAFGLQRMWSHLKSELRLVQLEIADCREMDAWEEQCQVILRASTGIDYREFFQFLCLIALPRIQELKETVHKAFHHHTGPMTAKGKAHVEPLVFPGLEEWLTKALSCDFYNFFGLRRQRQKELLSENESVTLPWLCKERLCIEPVAKDNVAAILRGCLQSSVDGKECSTRSMLSGLFAVIPDEAKEMVKQLRSSGGHGHGPAMEQSLLVTFRAYELHCVQTVMEELLQNKEFIAVSPQLEQNP